jgi:hypothetical protein
MLLDLIVIMRNVLVLHVNEIRTALLLKIKALHGYNLRNHIDFHSKQLKNTFQSKYKNLPTSASV